MAVTFAQQPAFYTPSDNPIVWTFTSNQTIQANFSFIVELYVDGAIHSAHQVFPESYQHSHFDASEIIIGLIPPAARYPENIFENAENYRAVHIIVREKYGSPATIHASATSATTYPFKARLSDQEFSTWTPGIFTTGTINRRFLTDAPNGLRIEYGKDFYLYIITNNQTDLMYRIEFISENGDLIYFHESIELGQYRISAFNIGIECMLNDIGLDPDLIVGSKYLRFSIRSLSDGTNKSETVEYEIYNSCNNFGAHVFWINKYGAYDQFSFLHNSIYDSDVSRQQFERQFGRWDPNNPGVWKFDTETSGTQTYRTKSIDKVQLVSDWITEEEQNWLVSLWDTPLIFMRSGVRAIKMDVAGSPPTKANEEFDELINVTLDLEYSNKRKSLLL